MLVSVGLVPVSKKVLVALANACTVASCPAFNKRMQVDVSSGPLSFVAETVSRAESRSCCGRFIRSVCRSVR